jgi:hypothetical protein
MGSLGLAESDGYGINATGQVTGLSFLPTTYTYLLRLPRQELHGPPLPRVLVQ